MKGIIAYIKSGFDAIKEKDSRIRPISRDISKYKRVIIGSPIWAGRIPPPFRTFLKTHKLKNKTIYLFFTSGSGVIIKALEDIKKLLLTNFSRNILSLKETEVKNYEVAAS